MRQDGSKVCVAALKARRRSAMKQLGSDYDVSFGGKTFGHAADVVVYAKGFLQQNESGMQSGLLRTRYVG